MRCFVSGFVCCLVLALNACAKGRERVVFLHSGQVVPSQLPFSEAVRVGDTLYLSGQIGVLPGTATLVAGGIREEAAQALRNIETILKMNGYSMQDVVRCTVMLADIGEWEDFNAVYRSFFRHPYPARSAFAASGLALNARVEIECMAAK